MSDISSIATALAPPTQGAPTAGKSILGKDDFLKIFLAQLGHQDPTAPVDSQAFVAQLAQFSSLELQQNANHDLESIMLGQTAAQQTAVTSLVGKDVLFRTDTITLAAGQSTTVSAQLGDDANAVTAVITDKNGKTVRTMQLGAHQAGAVALTWDGRDDAGHPQPAGDYKLAVTATDKLGASVAVDQSLSGHVTGVSFQSGTPTLLIGSRQITLSDIVQITERTTP